MSYLLDGDLNQMSIQKEKLLEKGLPVSQIDVYPAFDSKIDYLRALKMIWNDKIEGWWNYKNELVKNEICTNEQFKKGF